MAPEVADCRPYNGSSEVYTWGIIVWEMTTKERPYAHLDRKRYMEEVVGRNERVSFVGRPRHQHVRFVRPLTAIYPLVHTTAGPRAPCVWRVARHAATAGVEMLVGEPAGEAGESPKAAPFHRLAQPHRRTTSPRLSLSVHVDIQRGGEGAGEASLALAYSARF